MTPGRNHGPTVEQWSAEHVAAMTATAAVATLLVAGARRWGDAWTERVRRGLAAVIACAFVCEQLGVLSLTHLPSPWQ